MAHFSVNNEKLSIGGETTLSRAAAQVLLSRVLVPRGMRIARLTALDVQGLRYEADAVALYERDVQMTTQIMLDGKAFVCADSRDPIYELLARADAVLFSADRRVRSVVADGIRLEGRAALHLPIGYFRTIVLESGAIEGQRRAVVTMVLGRGFEKMAMHTEPLLKQYARRIDADYIRIDRPTVRMAFPHFEKWQMFELFETYDRIAFFDIDIIVSSVAPDIFDAVPYATVGGFDEGAHCDRAAVIAAAQNELGVVAWKHGYFNAGVGVYSHLHRPLFASTDTDVVLSESYFEQTTYNHRIAKRGYPVTFLSWEFNCMDCMHVDRFLAHCIHYAGTGFLGETVTGADKFDRKIALIESDISRISAKKGSA